MYNWTELYQDVTEEISVDICTCKGKELSITTYMDSDHEPFDEKRRSVTGVLIKMDNTPACWCYKR